MNGQLTTNLKPLDAFEDISETALGGARQAPRRLQADQDIELLPAVHVSQGDETTREAFERSMGATAHTRRGSTGYDDARGVALSGPQSGQSGGGYRQQVVS